MESVGGGFSILHSPFCVLRSSFRPHRAQTLLSFPTVDTRADRIAFLAAIAHLLAAPPLPSPLRPGLPGFVLSDRIAYLTTHRAAWTVGWLTWEAAAVSLLAF